MITRPPKTSKGYLYYHRLMWGRIVKDMEKGATLDLHLKETVWNSLFSFDISDIYCFACIWSNLHEKDYDGEDCPECLLEFGYSENCLGGLYDTATGIGPDRIEAAKKIRDLDMREKWK